MMYYYKIRHTNKKIDNYAGQLVFNPVASSIELPKKRWIYWEGNFPKFVEKCVQNIQEKNPSYHVYVLNPENVSEYSDIDFSLLKDATPQQKADLLRFHLLYQHGGIWLDASIIVYDNFIYVMIAVLQNTEQLHKNHLYSISILTHLCKIKKALKRAFLFYTNNGVE